MTSRHYLHTGQRTCHADDGQEVPCTGSGQDASFGVGTPWPEPDSLVLGHCRHWRFPEKVLRSGSGNVRFLKFQMCTTETTAIVTPSCFSGLIHGWQVAASEVRTCTCGLRIFETNI